MASSRLSWALCSLLCAAASAQVPPLTFHDLSPYGVVGNSGWNACFLNNWLGSDTTVAPNNGVWGAPTNPSGVPQCRTTDWVDGTCVKNTASPLGGFTSNGTLPCTPWNITAAVNAFGTKTTNFSATSGGDAVSCAPGNPSTTPGCVSTANGYFKNTPAPCWANTAPTSYAIPPGSLTWNGYSIANADGSASVPHFLDYTSVLYKDVNGMVHRQRVPAGACLPGNLVNVRTSAMSYTAADPSVSPIWPPPGAVGYPTGANQVYSTMNDKEDAGGLTWYTPRSKEPTPVSGNGGQPATLDTIRVYFALNFGLRNALDNSCDGRTGATTKSCVNGGYYASNLTTALLGDASKGLGRATYAVVRLCHSPTSTIDRPWRKKSGDAVNNKQCMDVKQLLFGAETEKVSAPLMASNATPNAAVALGSALAVIKPVNALAGIAVNGVPLTNYTNGKIGDPIIPAYLVNTSTASNVAVPSPVAFCRPLSVDPSVYPSGVHPDSSKGVFFVNSSYCRANQFTNSSQVDCHSNCVLSGQSWSVTKGTNVNLNDPAWYTVDIVFPADQPMGNYFVRVFVLDENYNYLGFGSSATSANLTNTASQNYFHVTNWASTRSTAARGTDIGDIRAGAAGCSALSLVVAGIFLARELAAGRKRARGATTVVEK